MDRRWDEEAELDFVEWEMRRIEAETEGRAFCARCRHVIQPGELGLVVQDERTGKMECYHRRCPDEGTSKE